MNILKIRSVAGISWKTILIFIFLAIFFNLFPEIDIWFSTLVNDPEAYFYLNNKPLVLIIYYFVEALSYFLVITLLVLLAISIKTKKQIKNLSLKGIIFLLLALAIGPGLMVNIIAKNTWGRARPAQIEQFGGKLKFSPAFSCSDQCETNCSFVSGHASTGFYFLSFALLFRRQRKLWLAIALGAGSLIGFARIYQGGHYLSDVIFSCFFVYFPIQVLYYLMFNEKQGMAADLK